MTEPVTLARSLLLAYAQPAITDAAKVQARAPDSNLMRSEHDMGSGIVRCYHPTGTFTGLRVLEQPWRDAPKWQAERSLVVALDWRGSVLRNPYTMVVAVLERGGQVRAELLNDNSILPASAKCPLREWTKPGEPK